MRRVKEADQRVGDFMWTWMWRVGAPIFAAAMLFYTLQDIGPSWNARFGDTATRGVVRVTDKDCSGKGGCSFYGDFASDDRRIVRRHVILATGFDDVEVGASKVAYDVGDRASVYPPGGGSDWLLVSLFVVGSILLFVIWILTVPVSAWRRWRGRPGRSD